jgi:hypothetical protein
VHSDVALASLLCMGKFKVGYFLDSLHIYITMSTVTCFCYINPLNAELNPICHLLALAGVHHFVDISRIMVNSDHWGVQKKKKSFDIQLQNVVTDLKLQNGFIHKISIKYVV